MKIVSLMVSGYRQFLAPTALTVPEGLTGLCGPNGVGKSKLVEAVGYALFGPQVLPKGDKVRDLASRGGESASPRVELIFEVRGQIYQITRTPREASMRLHGAAEPLVTTPTGVATKITELLRLTPETYHGTFVARQKEVSGLQVLPPQQRRRLVNRLIGITQVEGAIALAHQHRTEMDMAWQVQIASMGMASAEVATQLTANIADYEAAIAEENRWSGNLDAARAAHERCATAVDGLRTRVERVAGSRREWDAAKGHLNTLEATRRAAEARADEAAAAAVDLAAEEAILVQTTSVPDAVHRLDDLAQLTTLRAEKYRVQDDLDSCLFPLLQERDATLSELANIEAALERLDRESAEHTRVRVLAEQEAQHARQQAEEHDRHRSTAERLGPSGTCPTCGQAFREGLAQALTHHEEEATICRCRATDADRRAATARAHERGVQACIADNKVTRARVSASVGSYDTVPGEVKQDLALCRELDDALAAFPAGLRTQTYDPRAHDDAKQAMVRRERAQTEFLRLRPLAAREQGARIEAHNAARQIARLVAHCDQLTEVIGRDTPALDAMAGAQRDLSTAQAALGEADRLHRDAVGALATAEAQVRTARDQLERAEERERRVAAARRDLLVAQRTVDLLNRVLAEIAAEARPRLVELMDGWARALLGPHFRSIDLTPDYRILADNGSGVHEIDHFSGGEQTLLALMLRVAISLFCRERAGFDTGFLILDEVFGDQDADHRTQLVQFLREIKDNYHQILVVNHVADVTDVLDHIIDVTSAGPNVSTAGLRL